MTLAGWSCRKMPLQVPGADHHRAEERRRHYPGAAGRARPVRHRQNESHHGRVERAWRRGSKYEPVQNEESCALLDALVEGGAYYETRRSARWTRDLCDDAAVGADDVRRRRWLPRTARISTWPRSTLTVIEVSIPQACHLSRAPPTTLRPVGAVTPLPAHLVVCDPPVGLAQRPEATADRTGVGWRFP